MKNYKDSNNNIWSFENDCFDEDGKCTNKYVLKAIKENNLVEIADEEYNAHLAQKEIERLEEETIKKELAEAEKLIEFFETLSKLGLI